VNTYDFFRERVYDLAKEGHDPSDMKAAFAKAIEWPMVQHERVPLGLFYRNPDIPTYEDLEIGLRKGRRCGSTRHRRLGRTDGRVPLILIRISLVPSGGDAKDPVRGQSPFYLASRSIRGSWIEASSPR